MARLYGAYAPNGRGKSHAQRTTELDMNGKTTVQLRQLRLNHEAQHATERTLYKEVVAELDRREAGELDLARTLGVITTAARERRYVSYKDVAAASGVAWSAKMKSIIGTHLDEVARSAFKSHDIVLPAIVVNVSNVATGELDPASLRGFVRMVSELRGQEHVPEDAVAGRALLKQEQAAVFAWGRRRNAA